jgi:predicted enzyme related to lactoylglutathione lyase
MSSTILNITFDCADPRQVATFWGGVTGWPVSTELDPGSADCAVQPPDDGRPRLYFVAVPEGKTVKNRLHLDVIPADRTQDAEIARLTALGATVITDPRPELGWVVLADPEGNEFCVEMSAAELASDV